MTECRLCGRQVYADENGTLIDDSGGDVCGVHGGGEPHELDDVDNELLGLAVLDITGVTDDVPGMPDFL